MLWMISLLMGSPVFSVGTIHWYDTSDCTGCPVDSVMDWGEESCADFEFEIDTHCAYVHLGEQKNCEPLWDMPACFVGDDVWFTLTEIPFNSSKIFCDEEPIVDPACASSAPPSAGPSVPPTTPCKEPEHNWTEEIAEELCSADEMGVTKKGVDAVVCEGYNQNYQRRLNYSLANRLFLWCSAWCVYDAHTEGYGAASELTDAFIWRTDNHCYEPVQGLCIYGNTRERHLMAEYIETLCEPCIPSYAWDEDRAEEICRDNVVANKSYGAEVCEDPNSSTKQDNLDESLANKFFTLCTAWCVYDYYTIMNNTRYGTIMNNTGGFMWEETCWRWVTRGDCFEEHVMEFRAVSLRTAKLCEV